MGPQAWAEPRPSARSNQDAQMTTTIDRIFVSLSTAEQLCRITTGVRGLPSAGKHILPLLLTVGLNLPLDALGDSALACCSLKAMKVAFADTAIMARGRRSTTAMGARIPMADTTPTPPLRDECGARRRAAPEGGMPVRGPAPEGAAV